MPASGNVGVAFALVFGAGLSTTVGALAAFWAKLASTRTLAIGLGVSAGVMLYVSFIEIFMQKGVPALEDAGWENGYRWGTMMLFGGMFVTALIDLAVHRLSAIASSGEATKPQEISSASGQAVVTNVDKAAVVNADKDLESGPGSDTSSEAAAPAPGEEVHLANRPAEIPKEAGEVIDAYVTNDHHRFGLQKMGLMTALAIGIHNLPEGLATFVAALSDPLNGLAIAIAIALHNIPEGVCVAMPVYYASGSRWKGFWWAFVSGLSEPIGGFLGWLVLSNNDTDLAFGILFCLVAGMMSYISIKELIPTAIRFDPENKVTSSSVIAGMVIMAASLLMFTI